MSDKQTIVIAGTVFFPFLVTPCTKGKYPSNKFEYVLGQLDSASVAKLEAAGLGSAIKTTKSDADTDKGTFIVPKSAMKEGQYGPLWNVFEADGSTPMSEQRLMGLGNGSKVVAKVVSYPSKNGRSAGIGDITVVDYVEYIKEGGDTPADASDQEYRNMIAQMKAGVSDPNPDDWGTVDPSA